MNGGFAPSGYPNGYAVPQQRPMNGFNANLNGNPFSNNMQSGTAQQMTFTAASNAERNRLKQMEMRNAQTQNVNANAFGNDPFSTQSDDPFSTQNTGADDPFFAQNGGGGTAAQKGQSQQQNANDDPFSVWGL